MKGTHPQPRSPRRMVFRTGFRAGFRTGLRAGRRVIMWAALVMAIGIGVVWAGGRWMSWTVGPYGTPWHEPDIEQGVDLTASSLCVRGLKGGVGLSHEITDMRSLGFRLPRFVLREKWWPIWDGRWPDCGLWIPYWIPTLLCLATFAFLFRIEQREKRLARAGHCVCGYSLAGLADGVVCPECGAERASLPSGRGHGRS